MSLRSPFLLLALFLASTPFAQHHSPPRAAGDFVVADLFAEPDNLVRVSSISPATFSNFQLFLSTPVDYLRGLALDGPESGYFVSGYSETGGPTGFYRFENGRTTLVAPFPLAKWGSLADVSWSKKRDFLWYVWDPSGTQEETLYRIELTGTFTQVGELHYANGDHVHIAGGIALERHTGVLYSYDQNRAALLTVNPLTAEVTRVGASGLSAYPNTVIMSMDFSNDERLFLVRNFGTLYEVDAATGSARIAGAVNTACSALAFAPPPR